MANETYASGRWQVRAGEEEKFIDRWREFLGWTRESYDELEVATLLRSEADPQRFISFASWAGAEPRDEWKNSEEFMTRFMACRELCDEFEGGDFDLIVTF